MKKICVLSLLGFLLAGCATHSDPVAMPPPGPTLAEIQSMVHAQVSDSVIISQLQNCGTRYYLTADQIIDLKQAGVSDAVVNAIINTASKPQPQTTTVHYVYPWPAYGWGWGPYYYYGGYYYRGCPAGGWNHPHH